MAYILSAYAGAGAQLFDANGDPLVGGKIFTYLAGTTTPAVTYTSNSGTTFNSNPIILDSAGRTPSDIWVAPGVLYKFVLKTSTDTTIGAYDNVPGIDDPTAFNNLITVTGTNALVGTSVPAITGYTAGQTFSFVVVNTNTGAVTIDVDGRGAKNISVDNSTALAAGTLTAGSIAQILYDGVQFQLVGTSSSATTVSSLNGGQLAGMRNALINGSMRIAQRGTSFTAGANNDDTYNLDRWYVLSDGNDVVDITQNSAAAPTTLQRCIALDVETINKKFGIAQIIEGVNCAYLIGNQVTLSFKAKVSSTDKLDNVKAAIVAWSGTVDSVTSDIINVWGAEGTNPTLIANATYENTPINLGVTTSWATYSVTATVDTANAANIIVFIWSDVTDTTLGDFLYITDCQLELGSRATPFERRLIETELSLCQRYYEVMSYADTQSLGTLQATTTAAAKGAFTTFKTVKRVAPSAVAVTGTLVSWVAGGTSAGGTVTGSTYSTHGMDWAVASATGLVAGNASLLVASGAASAAVDVEL